MRRSRYSGQPEKISSPNAEMRQKMRCKSDAKKKCHFLSVDGESI